MRTVDNRFFLAYAQVEQMSIGEVQDKLRQLGRWPYERIAVRVLDWEEAVTRLKDDAQSALAMIRAVVAIEDQHGKLYLVRTPDLVTGQKTRGHTGALQFKLAVEEGYKCH